MKYFRTKMVWVNFEGEQRLTEKYLFLLSYFIYFRNNTEYFLQF